MLQVNALLIPMHVAGECAEGHHARDARHPAARSVCESARWADQRAATRLDVPQGARPQVRRQDGTRHTWV